MEGIYKILIPIFTALLTGVLGPILLYYLKRNDKSKEEELNEEDSTSFKVLSRQKEIDESIKKKLTNIKEKLNADRSWIIEFHNGQNSQRDVSLKKFSIAYECVSEGISSEKENFQNILVSFFLATIQNVIENKKILFESYDEIETEEMKRFFNQRGNSSMYIFSIEAMDGILIGMIGVDYVREPYVLKEEEIEYLEMQSNLISGYLQNRDFE